MGWIIPEDRMPPEGLEILLEVSGLTTAPYNVIWDHGFCIGSWIVPEGEEGRWLLRDGMKGDDYHLIDPTVHAWMPLPRHFAAPEKGFSYEEDLMEHAMFEKDPEWLYKDDCVYEQMTIDEYLKGIEHG